MKLSDRDLKRLLGVHAELQAVIAQAAADCSDELFVVTEGVRSYERQCQLFVEGKSKTMNSRHLTGHAVDLAVWIDKDEDKVVDTEELSWKFEAYKNLADIVKAAAEKLGVEIVWGGDFRNFKDGPHFELSRKVYR